MTIFKRRRKVSLDRVATDIFSLFISRKEYRVHFAEDFESNSSNGYLSIENIPLNIYIYIDICNDINFIYSYENGKMRKNT